MRVNGESLLSEYSETILWRSRAVVEHHFSGLFNSEVFCRDYWVHMTVQKEEFIPQFLFLLSRDFVSFPGFYFPVGTGYESPMIPIFVC